MATRQVVIDIDGLPTVIVPRDNNEPPIVLYTLPPPPYYKYADFELLDSGGPPPHHHILPGYTENDDIYCDPFWCKFILWTMIFIFIVSGTCIILYNL